MECHKEFCSEQSLQFTADCDGVGTFKQPCHWCDPQLLQQEGMSCLLCRVITDSALCPEELTITFHACCYCSLQSQPMAGSSVFTNEHWLFLVSYRCGSGTSTPIYTSIWQKCTTSRNVKKYSCIGAKTGGVCSALGYTWVPLQVQLAILLRLR